MLGGFHSGTDSRPGGGTAPLLRARPARRALAPGFELAAAVLRHLVADPLLPDDLVPDDWPAAALRADHRDYDREYRTVLGAFFRDHR